MNDTAETTKRKTDLTHLKPHQFKPGQSGNPKGHSFLKGELVKLKAQGREASLQAIGETLLMNKEQLQAVASNPESTMVQLLVASIMQKAIRDGCTSRAQFLMSYILGKAPVFYTSELTDTASVARDVLTSIPSSILIDLVKSTKSNAAAPLIDTDTK